MPSKGTENFDKSTEIKIGSGSEDERKKKEEEEERKKQEENKKEPKKEEEPKEGEKPEDRSDPDEEKKKIPISNRIDSIDDIHTKFSRVTKEKKPEKKVLNIVPSEESLYMCDKYKPALSPI